MQYIQVDTNFRSTRKFESQILDLQNYFYPFLNLAGICRKRKIKSLKKEEERVGAADASQAGPDPPAYPGLVQPNRYAAVQSRSDGARPFFSARRRMQAGATWGARVLTVLRIPRGGWWSMAAGSAAEVFRKVPREFLLACRACGARSDADVADSRPGKWWR
jgi:hypothetical protein